MAMGEKNVMELKTIESLKYELIVSKWVDRFTTIRGNSLKSSPFATCLRLDEVLF